MSKLFVEHTIVSTAADHKTSNIKGVTRLAG